LEEGLLNQGVYVVHLLAWVPLTAAVALHLWGAFARGGVPLVRSMASLQVRAKDGPGDWLHQLRRHFIR
ncbi:MAG: cytochrome B, partial [Cyanobium sp.]